VHGSILFRVGSIMCKVCPYHADGDNNFAFHNSQAIFVLGITYYLFPYYNDSVKRKVQCKKSTCKKKAQA
jgi:hypothetical protein